MKNKPLTVAAMIVALSFAGIVIGQTEVEKTEVRVSQIITRAEDHFRKGKQYLNDNKREKASGEFDKAIDTILESGMNVRESQRLQTFYLKLIERIYREEVPLEARSQIGFRDQKPNEASVDDLQTQIPITPPVAQDGQSLTTPENQPAQSRTTKAQRKQSGNQSQTEQAWENAELAKLRDDFVKATKEYKASLEKLIAFYEADVQRAETRFAQAKELFAQNLVAKRELDESERAVATAKAKVIEARQQIGTADEQIANALVEFKKPETTAKLVREYRQASARQPSCRNWTLTASRHQRGRTVTFTYKLICKY